MSDNYKVGYGKPPIETQFKPKNKAAVGRKTPKKKALSLPEIFEKALRTKRKIKRGTAIIDMTVAEILGERLVQIMTSGTARELALMVSLLERHAPDLMAAQAEPLELTYHRAEGSTVPLPPADLWKRDK